MSHPSSNTLELTEVCKRYAQAKGIAALGRLPVDKDVVRNNFPASEQNAVLPDGFFEEAGRVHKIQG
jgi:hypothetical protein